MGDSKKPIAKITSSKKPIIKKLDKETHEIEKAIIIIRDK